MGSALFGGRPGSDPGMKRLDHSRNAPSRNYVAAILRQDRSRRTAEPIGRLGVDNVVPDCGLVAGEIRRRALPRHLAQRDDGQ